MFNCATLSLVELEEIQRSNQVARKRRVVLIAPGEVTLENGTYHPIADSLYIDCTADALTKLEAAPLFRGKTITLRPVRHCQRVFSAAFIAHVGAIYDNDRLINELCRIVPHPDERINHLSVYLLDRMSQDL
ncbi:hypothetical protein DOTSEDRAFT_34794 [Dothistroma septosporum NZE10]|uniref:Uncharacterized protein n=1 Tax=Dothistroma septosporum (strain NZE10 / CBS 128990) TaxID=675120 RepID=N1PN36_DOTSN|nr:hypothetical protein DOTSEDRAFT_34794 [Dothistroma septosporum NZE10]